jgi:exodeoxyribonuclease VIII
MMKKMDPKTIRDEVAKNNCGVGYVDIPARDYHGMDDYVSNSMLRKMKESPAKFKWEMEHPRRSSPAQSLGTAIHAALLEPDVFERTYAAMPKFDRRTKVGKSSAEEWEASNKGKEPLSQDDMDTILRIHARVSDDEFFGQFFGGPYTESSFFAQDQETGLHLRCRCDNMLMDKNIIVDLKTTDCASRYVFNGDITKYGYLTQGAFYMDVVHAATGTRPDAFVIVAVEKSRDCDMQAFFFDDDALKAGRAMYRSWLLKLRECRASNVWPGYPREFIPYKMPSWLEAAVADGEFE